jgi:hypothetical protein
MVHGHSRAVLIERVPTAPSAATVCAEGLTVAAQRPGTGLGASTDVVVLELHAAVARAITKLKRRNEPDPWRIRGTTRALAKRVPKFFGLLGVF